MKIIKFGIILNIFLFVILHLLYTKNFFIIYNSDNITIPSLIQFKSKKLTIFEHKEHLIKFECSACHHKIKDKYDYSSCYSCHSKNYKKIMHKNCKSCHKVRIGKKGIKCNYCHLKR